MSYSKPLFFDVNISGSTGPTGAQGPQGITGPQGIPGNFAGKGDTGSQGAVGSQGATGEQGLIGTGGALGYYGSFYGDTGQTPPVGLTGYLYVNQTDSNNGVTLISPATGEFTIENPGVYNIQFSSQISTTTGSKHNIQIWLENSSGPIAWTNTQLDLVGSSNEKDVAAWNWFYVVTNPIGETLKLGYKVTDSSLQIVSDNTIFPQIPGTILTVQQVMYTQVGATGVTGPQGIAGSVGSQGETGSRGATGPIGPPGTVAGSWTVTSGTANYSFTVDPNNSYVMWLRGNIPNGIIVWNATVSISNTNVPVIGTQYAWNYIDAGSPLLLTTIPSQIIGTAGSIINTPSSYVGNSSTFIFGINNASGSNQVVYYGYIKL